MTFPSKKSITCLIIYSLFNRNEESSKCCKNCSILADFHPEWFIFFLSFEQTFSFLNCWSVMYLIQHLQKMKKESWEPLIVSGLGIIRLNVGQDREVDPCQEVWLVNTDECKEPHSPVWELQCKEKKTKTRERKIHWNLFPWNQSFCLSLGKTLKLFLLYLM